MKEILEINRYFQEFNRGYLLYPKDTNTIFLIHKTLNALADYELLFSVDISDEGHNIEKIKKNTFSGDPQKLF